MWKCLSEFRESKQISRNKILPKHAKRLEMKSLELFETRKYPLIQYLKQNVFLLQSLLGPTGTQT